jgi:riboflavin kinase
MFALQHSIKIFREHYCGNRSVKISCVRLFHARISMVAQLGTEAGSDAGWKLHVPYFASGRVVRGFGRGGKQLHCPTGRGACGTWHRRAPCTANLDEQCVSALPTTFPCGVYYGWAKVDTTDVYPMVMSIGYNPQFKNTVKTMVSECTVRHEYAVCCVCQEVHILHEFEDDFYDRQLSIIILGRIRSMTVFSSLGTQWCIVLITISVFRLCR